VDILHKPIKKEQLLSAVETALESK
jgi:FixJ family two-component response regulator